MNKLGSFVLIVSSMMATAATAREYEITQDNLKFSVPFLVIKPGDSVRFTNNDKVVHNVVSLTEDFTFNLGEFRPGMTRSMVFNELGTGDIECSIHPSMHMSIFVLK